MKSLKHTFFFLSRLDGCLKINERFSINLSFYSKNKKLYEFKKKANLKESCLCAVHSFYVLPSTFIIKIILGFTYFYTQTQHIQGLVLSHVGVSKMGGLSNRPDSNKIFLATRGSNP